MNIVVKNIAKISRITMKKCAVSNQTAQRVCTVCSRIFSINISIPYRPHLDYPDLCKTYMLYSLNTAIEPQTSATSSTWSSTTIQDNITVFEETTSDISSLQNTTSPTTEKDFCKTKYIS